WAVGGLEMERFTLRFPFSWRKHRRLFDDYVNLQRKIGFKRRIPTGITPHIGSQWWCLTRQTLSAILQDPRRPQFDRYFRRAWIPDESYFQTLTRLYSRKLESRSLTLSKFDNQGKPHIFYDDHLQLLRRSDCFVARKIWAHADRLYNAFLRSPEDALKQAEPQPGKIDRLFSRASERRLEGRPGLLMQSRFPRHYWDPKPTAQPYVVLHGFDDLFEGFQDWLSRQVDATVHGHLFAPDRVEFDGNVDVFRGGLTADAPLRDYNATGFLKNLIWNTRERTQCFQISPFDKIEKIHEPIAYDLNARVSIISGAWLIRHFKANQNIADIRMDAANRQKIEQSMIRTLKSPYAKAY
ncbi:MAG: beta-1,6-N-acetylglucosaminyltransferase, partial [Pseudomonadota bacterium]